jgi:hypothetical protein
LKENVHTEKQFLNLIHENLQLKNKLQWKCISKKEKKIIHLLAIGLKQTYSKHFIDSAKYKVNVKFGLRSPLHV